MSMMTGMVPTVNLKKTGENIKRIRMEAGISVKDVQTVVGLSTPQAVYSWQNGSYLPTVDNLIILAAMFGTTLDEIIAIDT